MIRLELKSNLNIDRTSKTLPQLIADSINKVMIRTYNVVRQNTPVDTGRLRSSIHFYKASPEHLEGKIQSQIKEGVNYAVYVELGTKPHRPPVAPILRWAERKFKLDTKRVYPVALSIINKIAKKGTVGRFFFQKGATYLKDNMPDTLKELGFNIEYTWEGKK